MSSAAVLEGQGLCVEFHRRHDRFAHQISIRNGSKRIVLLRSVEGLADESWPRSPALQELDVTHGAGGRQTALLVGMAGTSHWSLSVELDPALGRLAFDVACRVKEPPHRVGSTYDCLVPACLCEQGIRIGQTGLPLALRVSTHSEILETSNAAASSPPNGARLDLNPDGNPGEWPRISITPAEVPGGQSWPRTVRWMYHLDRLDFTQVIGQNGHSP